MAQLFHSVGAHLTAALQFSTPLVSAMRMYLEHADLNALLEVLMHRNIRKRIVFTRSVSSRGSQPASRPVCLVRDALPMMPYENGMLDSVNPDIRYVLRTHPLPPQCLAAKRRQPSG